MERSRYKEGAKDGRGPPESKCKTKKSNVVGVYCRVVFESGCFGQTRKCLLSRARPRVPQMQKEGTSVYAQAVRDKVSNNLLAAAGCKR